MLTVAVCLRSGQQPQLPRRLDDGALDPASVVTFVAEILTVLGCLLTFIMQGQEVKFLGLYLAARNLVSCLLKYIITLAIGH